MAEAVADSIGIEVTYALPDRQELITFKLPLGATVQTAIEMSGLLQKYPEIDIATARFGIYSRLCKPDTILRDRDRVEIYRPLIADPKEVRRQRATAGKAAKKAADAAKPRSR
jgi:putative ubiquitin-RnfH superfamily antitoxin RatB of RatAB toxin-antitoxin module